MAKNKNLSKARNAKNDEFYTRLEDIQDELYRYEKHFKDKVIFCNCDDHYESNFWFYFHKRFKSLGLKKLISTHYNKGKKSFKLEYTGGNDDDIYSGIKTDLKGDGDFKSDECIKIVKEANIVVTNPPFSELRAYIKQLMKYKKDFLIIGNQNAITYKEIFSLLKDNKVWLGYKSGDMAFAVPDYYKPRKTRYWEDENGQKWRSLGNICWFTNLDIDKRHRLLDLVFSYEDNSEKYQKYDNYNAINVDKVADIPYDYKGYMGVSITFMNKFNPDQFEVFGIMNTGEENEGIRYPDTPHGRPIINGKEKYLRILIKNKNPKSKKEALGLE